MKSKMVDFGRLAFAGVIACAGVCGAVSNEGGTYELNAKSAFGEMRTTGQTGDQVYVVTEPAAPTRFWPGANDATPYAQIFTGAPIRMPYQSTGSQEFRIMGGHVVFENEVVSDAALNYVGLVSPADLVLRNGGSFTTTRSPLDIGHLREASPNATGVVYVEAGSRLAGAGAHIRVGNGSTGGALWVDGGTVALSTGGVFNVSCNHGCGYARVADGLLQFQRSLTSDGVIGAKISTAEAVYGSLHVSGGRAETAEKTYRATLHFQTSTAKDARSDVYVDGGVLDLSNVRASIGYWPSAGAGRAALTVDGDGLADLGLAGLGCNASCSAASGGQAVYNLNGGALRIHKGFADYGAKADRWVNFNGGTLALRDGASLDGTGTKVVYPRGGAIEVASGMTSALTGSFRAAQGHGVESIVLDAPGAGYVTAPEVTISGGSGSNATAYAVLKRDRTLEKIVVTCRGEGYAADDALTVSISAVNGGGASAHVSALTPNTTPVLRKTGGGTLDVTQDVRFDGVVLSVEAGTMRLSDGTDVVGLAGLRVLDGALLRPWRAAASVSSVNRLDAAGGIADIRYEGGAGVAELDIGLFTRANGLALVSYGDLALKIAETEFLSTSESAPVVNGLFARGTRVHTDVAEVRDPNVYVRGADGTLTRATLASSPAPDACWHAANGTFPCTAVNSVTLPVPSARDAYLQNDGPIEIQSGMILGGHNGNGVSRVGVSGTGAYLTTRAKGGLVIWEDNTMGRSRSTTHDNEVYHDKDGSRRFIIGKMADPDAQTPMTVTVAGPRCARPEQGALVWDISENDFSGGLVLLNGGVLLYGESGLGRAGCPVDAYGYSAIVRGPGGDGILTVGTRPLRIHAGAALLFSPCTGNQGNAVAATISGEGDLLTSDSDRSGYAIAYTGDHSAFTGAYYVRGHARIAPETFSPLATVCLADGTSGIGVIETCGTLTRAPGTGAGELCWRRHTTMPAAYGLRGGFAAKGGDFTVDLGGEGAKLVAGSDYLPAGAVIQLQSQYADGKLTVRNGFELNGREQAVRVWDGKTATLAGAVSDKVGGGRLAVTGNIDFTGALEVARAASDSPMLVVDGALTFAEGASVPVAAEASELEAFGTDGLVLATATGGITGLPALGGDLSASWRLVVKDGRLLLKKMSGLSIIVR